MWSDDSESDAAPDEFFSSTDSEDVKETEFERKARKRDEKIKLQQAEADAELKTNIGDRETYTLPSGQEIERESRFFCCCLSR